MSKFIGFGLRPMPDEIVDSFIARHISLVHPKAAHVMWKTLGRPYPGQQMLLPSGLSQLACGLPDSSLNFDMLVRQHTAFPMVAPLLSIDRRATLLAALATTQGCVGSNGFRSKGLRLLYCAECRAEQLHRFGSAGWRRVHQLDGVFVCPQHEQTLLVAPFHAFTLNGYDFIQGATVTPIEIINPLTPQLAASVARLAEFQLSDPSASRLLEDPPSLIRQLFRVAGLVRSNGYLRFGVNTAFREAFGAEALRTMGVPLGVGGSPTSWVHNIVNGTSRITPLKLTLILAYMRVDLNAQTGLLSDPIKMPRLSKEISGDSYPLLNPLKLEAMRRDILSATSEGLNRAQLLKREPYAYRTLKKHDPAWMETHLPRRLPFVRRRTYGSQDDQAFLERLRSAHRRIISQEGLPTKITAHLLMETVGRRLILMHSEQLPRCSEFIERHADTSQSFWQRRFDYGVTSLSTSPNHVSWREFVNHIRYKTSKELSHAKLAYARLCAILNGP